MTLKYNRIKKKKILFWLEMFDKGGIEKVTLDLVNNLNPDKYDITVYQKFKGGYCKSQLNPNIKSKCCFPFFANGIARIFVWFPGEILYKIFIHTKYDVEIAVGDGGPSKVIRGSYNNKSKKISWIHMDVIKDGWIMPELSTREKGTLFYQKFNNIICVSNECKDSFIKKFGCENKVSVLYNPVPSKEIVRLSKEPLDIKFNSSVLNIITVGRLSNEKGYDRLLRVHKKLISEGYRYHLYIVGEGKDFKLLETYIKENNLSSSVTLLGFQSNPYKYIKKADLFVCSSRHEAFSTVQSESIILGTPVLTTKCAGTKDLLGDSEYGMIVDNSEEGIYTGLVSFLENKDLLKKYTDKAKERSSFFDLETNVKKWEKLLDE